MTPVADYLLRSAAAPFAWGSCDCLLWAAGAVAAVTGRDPVADLRGTYGDARAALRIIRAAGGIEALAAERLDPVLRRDAQAHEGVGLVSAGRRRVGCVLSRGRVFVKGAPRGIIALPGAAPKPVWSL